MGIPKSARKLTVQGEQWRWRTDGWHVTIWSPEEMRHVISAETAFGQWNKGCDCCGSYGFDPGISIEPGMIRKYIEEKLMKQIPVFIPENPAVGKLFVYRHKSPKQGASISVHEMKGGEYQGQKERYDVLLKRFAEKHPLFLVRFTTSEKEKVSYAKFLIVDMIVELKIDYPRTFRGSFMRYDDWREMQEAEADAG